MAFTAYYVVNVEEVEPAQRADMYHKTVFLEVVFVFTHVICVGHTKNVSLDLHREYKICSSMRHIIVSKSKPLILSTSSLA